MTTTIEARITAIKEDAQSVAAVAECDLGRAVVYVSRSRIMLAAIQGVTTAMDQIECDGAPSDFNDDWRQLRSRLAHAQTRFEAVISGSQDTALPPCQVSSRRRVNSRDWI